MAETGGIEHGERVKNPAAVALGKMGRGKPKRYTEEERERRRQHINAVRARRLARIWARKEMERGAAALTAETGRLRKEGEGMPPAQNESQDPQHNENQAARAHEAGRIDGLHGRPFASPVAHAGDYARGFGIGMMDRIMTGGNAAGE